VIKFLKLSHRHTPVPSAGATGQAQTDTDGFTMLDTGFSILDIYPPVVWRAGCKMEDVR